jgi:hypothetical protein
MNSRIDETAELANEDDIPAEIALAFAPLHKRAFGMAVGTAFGAFIFLITAVAVVFPEGRQYVGLLSQYFAGYSVSWQGAFIGLAWGWFVGFVMGWFTAYTRNFVLAAQIWLARAKQDLGATRDLLDHI